ncbi:MAG: CoA-binding protein [Actinomycetota bacterium]|jgi:predicted CoA-binding protein|nr:CoA-binding protein [Actinomycetota bacterium]
MPYGDDATVSRVLSDCQTWAVVGLSDDPFRAAWGVAQFLQAKGKRVVPVHPRAQTVFGEKGYRSLADIPFPVDCVDVFRRSEEAGRHADEAVEIGAKAVWFQLGVVHEAAGARAAAAGLDVVMDRCPKIDWGRLGPR